MAVSARFQVGAVVLAAAGAGWVFAPEPTSQATLVRPLRDEWQLPALPRRPDTLQTAALVQGAPYWGQPEPQAATEAPPENRRWRLAGVVGREGRRGVLIRFEAPDKADQVLRVGDKLPSGAKITSISAGEVGVQDGRRQVRLAVERLDV